MATNLNLLSRDHTDYIDIEITSQKNFSHLTNSPTQSAEFEFKMPSVSSQTDTVLSPADDLFYKGKLLPLHLSLRLQMFKKLLPNSDSDKTTNTFDALSTPPLTTTTHEYFLEYSDESCHVSRELDVDKYVFYDSSEERGFINLQPRKRSTKMFKFIKQSLIRSKVKASQAYIKSLFTKTSCCSTVDCVKMDSCSFSSRPDNLKRTYELKFDSELENSIQSAIAHCKRSHQRSVSDIGFCSFSGSRVVFEDHER